MASDVEGVHEGKALPAVLFGSCLRGRGAWHNSLWTVAEVVDRRRDVNLLMSEAP